MKKPKMILFDYGQTLVDEQRFDGVAGNRALLTFAAINKYGRTPEEVRAAAVSLDRELCRFDPAKRHLYQIEIPNHIFTTYLYRSLGIELSLTPQEIDRIFWDAAAPGVPTEGIGDFLAFLSGQNIRTGVISNISYCGQVVEERISRLLPQHRFEFILATSEYMFRKPHRRIFELALEMAGLPPEDVWYAGDNYPCDVAGARNAGLFPVWYVGATHAPAQPEGDVLTISHWDRLKSILAEGPHEREHI